MPLQSTSGALSTYKIPLVQGNNEYWIITSNVGSLRMKDFIFNSQETCFVVGDATLNSNIFSAQINQYFGQANISWQKIQNLTADSNVTTAITSNNNILYNIYNTGEISDGNAYTVFTTTTGVDLGSYIDLSNVGGNTGNSLYPMKRQANDIIVDEVTGNYWISGKINQRANITSNNFVNYLTHFGNNNTKINSYIFSSNVTQTGIVSYRQNNQIIKDNSSNNIILAIPYQATTALNSFNGIVGFDTNNSNIAWQIYIPYPANALVTGTINTIQIAQDNSSNIYAFSKYARTTGIETYLQKFNNDCTLQYYSRKLQITSPNTTIATTDITTDSNNNPICCLTAGAGANNVFNYIVKIDEASGNKIFENRLNISNTISSAYKIKFINDNLYILFGRNSNENFNSLIKLPADGSIPGNGNYNIGSNVFLSYISTNQCNVTIDSTGVVTPGIFSLSTVANTEYNLVTLSSNNTISPYTVSNIN